MSLNILILGTSNSIIRTGWTKGFRDALPHGHTIDNRSVGGSPGIQFAEACINDLSGYDFVVLDSIVNDENLMRWMGSRDHYRAILFDIFSTIASQSNLVTLGFCNARFADDRSWIYHNYAHMTRRVGGRFVSAIDFAQTFAGPQFKDNFHIASEIAYAFGARLAERLPDLGRTHHRAVSYAERFSQIVASDICDAEVFHAVNSMTDEKFAMLRPGYEIRFDRAGKLLGLKLDSTRTHAAVQLFAADTVTTKSMRYGGISEERRFLTKFVPIHDGFDGDRLVVVSPQDSFLASNNEIPRTEALRPELQGGPQLALARLVFWAPPPG